MFRHNFLLAFRNFKKFRSIFLINLLGLTLGITTVILISLWVKDELGINRQHALGDRIFSVITNHDNAGGIVSINITPAEMAEAMAAELPQVEKATAVSPYIDGMSLSFGEDATAAAGYYVDQEYFDIFSVDFILGNPNEVLKLKEGLALSETAATRLFGSPERAMGKSVKWEIFTFEGDAVVSAVFKDFDSKNTTHPEYFLNFKKFKEMLGEGAYWGNFNAGTFVLLHEGTDVAAFNAQLLNFIKIKQASSNVTAWVQPFEDIYLHNIYENGKVSGGRITYIWIFSAIALFILAIACINFMNLTTARSMTRAKEIGVKKTMGADQAGLIKQFLTESFSLTILALLLSLILVALFQNEFNSITQKELHFGFSIENILLLATITGITGLLAGIYPSLYLSRFRPIQAMRSNMKGSFGEILTRKGLVVIQFSISLSLIIAVFVISSQMEFIKNKNLGFNLSNVIQVKGGNLDGQLLETFLSEAKRIPGVVNASSVSHPMVGRESATIGLEWEGKNPDEEVRFDNFTMNYGLIETLEFEMVEGRSFAHAYGDEKSKIILNEAAVKSIGLEEPIGKIVNLWGEDKEVIGVVKDFNFESIRSTVAPAFLKYDPGFAQKLMIRIGSDDQDRTIASLKGKYQEIVGLQMDYSFFDEDYQSLYMQEQRVSLLANYFGVVAIFLSCLGLFGLAAFTAEKRKKEIGVRKVMGASTMGILTLVSKDFVRLILISIVIAMPLTWYFANNWLKSYAYQTNLSWWIFAVSGLLLILIAVITVGVQAFKAASANPVDSLKSE